MHQSFLVVKFHQTFHLFSVFCFMSSVSCFMFHVSCFMFHVSCFMFRIVVGMQNHIRYINALR